MKQFVYRIAIVSVVLGILSQPVSAADFDEQFYSGNDILFYDPRSGDVCDSSSSIQLEGSDNQQKAFNFFVSNGYSEQQSAGIVGNMIAESNVSPMRLQGTPPNKETSSSTAKDSLSGWGLVQWTPAGKMINPSKQSGKEYAQIDTLEHQLQFLSEQLNGTGTGAKISEKAAGDDLKKQTTIDGSARSFMTKFERPEDQSESAQKARSKLANAVFGKYSSGGVDVGETSSEPTTTDTDTGCSAVSTGDIVSIAQAELKKNIKENPIGCDAGNPSKKGSCGAEVDKYTDGTLEYWCADFVSWVYKTAGKPFTGGASGGWRIASVSGVRAWFEKNGRYTQNGPGVTPKPGDTYMTAGESHIGIVEKVEDGKVYTISGNTSVDNYSNGVGVGTTTYPLGSTDISGYGSLK